LHAGLYLSLKGIDSRVGVFPAVAQGRFIEAAYDLPDFGQF
jgi:hypothetical protein